jgi:hypothetical protein
MKLFRNKVWSWFDIGLLKWSSILVGVIVGAYLHEYVMPYVWVILGAAVLLAIRPATSYWRD